MWTSSEHERICINETSDEVLNPQNITTCHTSLQLEKKHFIIESIIRGRWQLNTRWFAQLSYRTLFERINYCSFLWLLCKWVSFYIVLCNFAWEYIYTRKYSKSHVNLCTAKLLSRLMLTSSKPWIKEIYLIAHQSSTRFSLCISSVL